MKNSNLSDAELTAYSAEHLLYELGMFWFTANELAQFAKPSPKVSVLIESFGIHLRNLIDFFCTPAGSEKDDDVIASDFAPGWNEAMSPTLKAARERVNKELSHLTLKRKSGLDPSKPWDVAVLLKEVTDMAENFAGKASPAKLSSEVPKWLKTVSGPANISVGPLINTSNVTSAMTTSVIVVGPPSKNPTP